MIPLFILASSYCILITYASEIFIPTTMGGYRTIFFDSTNCPYSGVGLTPFEGEFNNINSGDNIVVNNSLRILVSGASITPNTIINRITITNGSALIFSNENINIHVREIYVEEGGEFLIGSESCRLNNSITITFHGSKIDSSLVDNPIGSGLTSKGLIASGRVDMHGALFHPTWTRLSTTSVAGSDRVRLVDSINWVPGQRIIILTTVLRDCPDSLADDWCNGERHQNEERLIVEVNYLPDTGETELLLDTPLSYMHYAGAEYQGEVALLSRSITLVGTESHDDFGGHTKIKGEIAEGRFRGVHAENMGQLNVLGRYPFHFHMMRNASSRNSYFEDCLVTNSRFRGYVVHGTNYTRVSRNVAFNVSGSCYYLEDGVEEYNTFEYNLAAHVNPIYRPANGGWGQGGEYFRAIDGELLIPADTSAAGFYISNAMNRFVGNVASGGWSGFAFPNLATRLGAFHGSLPDNTHREPLNRPLLEFYGNTAHSAGFYWDGYGSFIYVGGWLEKSVDDGVLEYRSGRHERNVYTDSHEQTFMYFENTKVFLCNTGIAHWGNNVHIEVVEVHDVRKGAMMFGRAALNSALINMHSDNPNAIVYQWNTDKVGFQFYDTWTQTILSNVTFRNVNADGLTNECAVRYMDHSDHYTPQGINAVRGMVFENVESAFKVCIDHCGEDCGSNSSTMASRMYSVWDFDGSLSETGVPTVLGSNQAWWNVDDTCSLNPMSHLWSCPWRFEEWDVQLPSGYEGPGAPLIPNRTVGYIQPYIPGLLDGCDYDKFSDCTDQYASYLVGRMSHWGVYSSERYLAMGPWAGVAGMTNMGWYWRTEATSYGIDGALSYFEVDIWQNLARGSFVVLAVAYPPGTTFEVSVELWWNEYLPSVAMSPLDDVLALSENLLHPDDMTCNLPWWDNSPCAVTGAL